MQPGAKCRMGGAMLRGRGNRVAGAMGGVFNKEPAI